MVSPGLVDTMAVCTPAPFRADSSSTAPGSRRVPLIISSRPGPLASVPTVMWNWWTKAACRSGSASPVRWVKPFSSVMPTVVRTCSTVGAGRPRAEKPSW